MSKLTDISKEIGWQPIVPPLKYPRPDELDVLEKYCDEGNESAFAQIFRYNRFLHSPKTATEEYIMRRISKIFNKTKKLFE